MHLTLEALNHILTVITVTAFLYSRKDFFKDIIDSKLLPGHAQNKVHILSKEIEGKIRAQIEKKKKTDVLGFEMKVYDFDDKEINTLSKLLAMITELRIQFTKNHYNTLRQKQKTAIEKVNKNFTNTAFYIALVSFSLLILAAGFQHEDTPQLRIFITVYNLINICFLIFIYFKQTSIRNTKIIRYFFISLFLSSILAFIPGLAGYFHTQICSKADICHFLIKYTGSPSGYNCDLLITLIFLLSPWIICFLHFSIIYFTTSKKLLSEEKPIIDKLNQYLQYLKTREEMN